MNFLSVVLYLYTKYAHCNQTVILVIGIKGSVIFTEQSCRETRHEDKSLLFKMSE